MFDRGPCPDSSEFALMQTFTLRRCALNEFVSIWRYAERHVS
jgi:hypothetical protein